MGTIQSSRFDHLSPSEDDKNKIEEVREAFRQLEEVIEKNIGHSRYGALAITSLETAAMWAMKSITHSLREL